MEPLPPSKTGRYLPAVQLVNPTQRKTKYRLSVAFESTKMGDWCDYLVEALGISELLDRHVSALSGGQQQRVAIARALAHKPKLLLADEPTGNLDHKAGLEVMRLLNEITTQGNTAVLLVTHSPECASFMQTRLVLDDGKLKRAYLNQKQASDISYVES